MRPTIAVLSCVLFVLQASPAWTQADQEKHVIGVDEVWESVSDAPDTDGAQRAQILRVLQHPTTREAARGHGLDLAAAENAVRVLGPDDLQQLSARAAAVESSLSGGHTITTNTLIIILLIIIVLILIV